MPAPIQRLVCIFVGCLDVILYRLVFFRSIFHSRQAIQHNKVFVNGKYIKNSNFTLHKDDFVEFCPMQRSSSGLTRVNLELKVFSY